tara:strand:+ start:3426 stop:5945 length:2520 start_codon:yes stop_codon:yes gene_type:complete
MALTITKRPEKTLINGYTSRWNSSELPLKYTFLSDLYPVNNYDSAFIITNGAYNYALKGYELTIALPDFINLDSIQVTGTNTSLDGGIFSIKGTTATTVIIDYFTTETTVTGSLIKYYNNYNGIVKVYAGARDGHPYNTDASKPFNLIGEIIASFDTNNEGSIDVRSYIKPDITADFDANNENSHFAWTDFTIEYSESYDLSDGTNVNTFNSDFEEDKQDNCTPLTNFIDPSFDNGLTDWNEECDTAGCTSWIAGVGFVNYVGNEIKSNILNQDKTVYNGVLYTLTLNLNVNILNGGIVNGEIWGYNGALWSIQNSFVINALGAFNTSLDVVPSEDLTKLGVTLRGSGIGANIDVDLQDFAISSLVAEPCLIYSSAIFGAKQFQDALGGNFGDYVLNIVDEFTPKMLTRFEEIRKFEGVDAYFNALIPESTFSLSEGGDNVFLELNLFDRGNNNVLAFNYPVVNLGSGVYTVTPTIDEDLDFNNVLPCEWEYGTARFIIIPSNTFSDADNGTFENGTATGLTNLPYSIGTPNQVGDVVSVGTIPRTGVYNGNIGWTSPTMNEINKTYSIFENDSTINVTVGRTYEITSYQVAQEFQFEPSQQDNASFYWLPDGYTKSECVVLPWLLISDNIVLSIDSVTPDRYKKTVTTFVAKTTESLKLKFYNELTTDINIGTGGSILMDDITFKGPFEYISEEKTVNNSCGCFYGNVLRWKNDLGGWETWDFKNKRIESERVTNKINIKRDVTQDWDNYYINGETENDTIKTDVSRSITFNSQILTNNEYKTLQAIKRSVRVQMLQESGKWQTVTIRSGSYEIVNDNEKIKELSVSFDLPSTKTQEQ